MNTNIFNEYPGAKEHMNRLRENSIYNLLNYLRYHDETYKQMITNRAESSMAVREIIENNKGENVFEIYSDAIYAIVGYERKKIYERGFTDALKTVKRNNR